jgi:hypothetical protein
MCQPGIGLHAMPQGYPKHVVAKFSQLAGRKVSRIGGTESFAEKLLPNYGTGSLEQLHELRHRGDIPQRCGQCDIAIGDMCISTTLADF